MKVFVKLMFDTRFLYVALFVENVIRKYKLNKVKNPAWSVKIGERYSWSMDNANRGQILRYEWKKRKYQWLDNA